MNLNTITAGNDEPSRPRAIVASGVSVYYQRPKRQTNSFKDFTIQLLKGPTENKVIKALDEISIEIQKGEVYGIIGRNGAGKSTLLKVLTKIIHPTHGRMQIWGNVTPLLSVGAGFHPEFSGRENILLY